MAGLTMKKLITAFIPLALEIVRRVSRDTSHNNNIKKFDKTDERLNTIENLVVRLEKKALANREEIRKGKILLMIWMGLNSALLVAIAVKVFF